MNLRAHYIRLYKRLGLANEATIADLKHRFHSLANQYHPDKSSQKEASSDTTEIFTEIQSAYQELKSYHSQHGFLPLENLNSRQSTEQPDFRTTQQLHRPSFSIKPILSGIMLIILLTIFLIPHKNISPTTEGDLAPQLNESNSDPSLEGLNDSISVNTHPTSPEKINVHPITLGMSMGKVFEIIGVPDDAVGDIWYYGTFEIYFRDGRVSGWLNDASSTIKTDSSQPLVLMPTPVRH
jgi:hypothetical protein